MIRIYRAEMDVFVLGHYWYVPQLSVTTELSFVSPMEKYEKKKKEKKKEYQFTIKEDILVLTLPRPYSLLVCSTSTT